MLDGVVHYDVFLFSALLFAMTPGLDTVFVLNKALCSGRRPAVFAAVGVNCGILVHTVVGALGLSAVLAASAAAFTAVKLLGAAYLAYLAFKAFTTRAAPVSASSVLHQSEGALSSLRSGLVANVLNPKVALFVLAFFPQFIDPSAAGPAPFLVLGASYAAVGLAWYLLFAWFASFAGAFLMRRPSAGKWLNRASGLVYLALSARIAMVDNA